VTFGPYDPTQLITPVRSFSLSTILLFSRVSPHCDYLAARRSITSPSKLTRRRKHGDTSRRIEQRVANCRLESLVVLDVLERSDDGFGA
jgi:hypothetical protein